MDQPGLGDARPWSRGILGGRAPSLTSAFYCSHQPSLVSLLGSLAFRGPPSWLGPCFPCCLVLVLVVVDLCLLVWVLRVQPSAWHC